MAPGHTVSVVHIHGQELGHAIHLSKVGEQKNKEHGSLVACVAIL